MSFRAVTPRSIFLPPPVREGVSEDFRGLGASKMRTGVQPAAVPEGLCADTQQVAAPSRELVAATA